MVYIEKRERKMDWMEAEEEISPSSSIESAVSFQQRERNKSLWH